MKIPVKISCIYTEDILRFECIVSQEKDDKELRQRIMQMLETLELDAILEIDC